jgi:hypothetical protein
MYKHHKELEYIIIISQYLLIQFITFLSMEI